MKQRIILSSDYPKIVNQIKNLFDFPYPISKAPQAKVINGITTAFQHVILPYLTTNEKAGLVREKEEKLFLVEMSDDLGNIKIQSVTMEELKNLV